MSKTLTVTIINIPDDLWRDYWIDAKKISQKELGGLRVEESESITVDCDELGTRCPAALHGLLAGASTGHALYQFDQEYNQQP